MKNYLYSLHIAVLLLFSTTIQAELPTARTDGPFYASDNRATPYLQLGDLLTHFRMEILNNANTSTIQRSVATHRKQLDFSKMPEENSHSVGEGWYRVAIADKKAVVLSWAYAGSRHTYWFAARLFQGELQTASNQSKTWQVVEPNHSKYENWTVKGVKLESEIFNPGNESQFILYRFRLTNDQKMLLRAPQAAKIDTIEKSKN